MRRLPLFKRSGPAVDAAGRAWLHALYVEHADVVFRYAASRVGHEAADEIVAETFVEAVASRDRYDAERGHPRAWLLGIATNRLRRRRQCETDHLGALPQELGATDDRLAGLPDRLDAEAMSSKLRRGLAALPASERAAFLLHVVAELPPADVAVALGIAPTAARVRLHRARARLRADLTILTHEEASR